MNCPETLYIKHMPTRKLQRQLKIESLSPESRQFILQQIHARRRLRRKYPTQRLRTMSVPELRILLPRMLLIGEEDIMAVAPVIKDIPRILQNECARQDV